MTDRQMTWDELCAEMVKAQRARDEWQKTSQTAAALNDALIKSIEKVTQQRDEARAKCAELSRFIINYTPSESVNSPMGLAKAQALSGTPSGWRSPMEFAALEAKWAAIRDAFDALHDFVDGQRQDTENIAQIINACVSADCGKKKEDL